jgi:F0F1-type ATP synthase delta subunit
MAVRPELVAGLTITINDDLRFDGSLKGKIDKLFN